MHRTSRPSGAAPRGLRIFVCLLLVAAFTPVLTAQAVRPLPAPPTPTTYYVDVVTGDDANTGGMADPLKSISRAATESVSGDTIIVAPGAYSSSETSSSGEEFPILIREGVTLKSSDGSAVTIVSPEWSSLAFVIGSGPAQAADAETAIEPVPVTVEGLTVTRGAEEIGGGFFIGFADAVLRDVVITECFSMMGGGIHAENSSLKLEDCVLEHNGWDPDFLMEIDGDPPPMAINDMGGAMFAGGCMVVAERTSFNENAAVYTGAAVFTEETWFTTKDCSFYGNYVTAEDAMGQEIGTDSGWSDGSWESSAIETDRFIFEGHVGGAIAAWGPNLIDVAGTEFIENGSPWAGAIGASEWTDVSIVGSEFFGNYAIFGSDVAHGSFGDLQEAGIEIPRIESSVVPDEALDMNSLLLDQCVIEDAFAYEEASIISMEGSSTIQNCLFDNNDVGFAIVEAGMMMDMPQEPYESEVTDMVATPSLAVVNSTFADNTAFISVIVHPFMDALVWNSIFWGNAPAEDLIPDLRESVMDGLSPIDDLIDVLNAEVIYSDLEYGWDWEIDVPIDTGNISEDPLFVMADARDYRLSPTSPCMETATSTAAPAYDLPGTTRPQDGDNDGEALWDMGAYEAIYSGTLRTGGETRYGTSVKAVQEYYDEADVVVLARGDLFADGLAASGLCGVYDAPLLLTLPSELPYQTRDEIVRLGASKAYIMGGTGAISDGVKAELEAMGLTVERIGGYDRYATAALIAEEIISEIGTPTATFIARGDLFADALTVSPVAYGIKSPILLVRTGDLPDATIDVLGDIDSDTVVIAGGSGAVSFGVEKGIESVTVAADRIDGADRYETSVAFSEYAIAQDWAKWMTTGLATGVNFPDALTGGPAIGTDHGVLLLTPGETLHASVETALTDNKAFISRLDILGGSGAISDSVMAAAEDAIK